MIRFGTIGTSWITEEFLQEAVKSKIIKFTCLYTRDKNKGKLFVEKNKMFKTTVVTSFQDMIENIDAVYIASPNGLHYEQAKYFLAQQKHVLVEKPITFTYEESIELAQIAKMNNVILMEAMKTIHLPQFGELIEFNNKHNAFCANLSMNQYSSRMPDVKNGIYKGPFDEILGKGSTYDMLIYPVALAIALFGAAEEVKSFGQKLLNNTNVNDAVIIKHENGTLTNIMCSKSATGVIGSEILSEDATLSFGALTMLEDIKIYNRLTNENKILFKKNEESGFKYILDLFIKMILNNDFKLRDNILSLSCEIIRVLNMVEDDQ
ncbi:Gfo/Idh/MocA family oxidoreductase [Spiroplasma sp. TIUS-1]|uniref:Gfo/Idh/MocA family protein n=1 Tax=Spiroplasma sp. TIUS-1 TaxID=216963 RepID=UPI001397DC26|nr:Gfo/Idh/MocA family oxidoreductase [Spiroplasma sp. TIUS-1]QHX35902.1 Gfo/Idh/MocA family oxidoreductase [Spiroplasma sp. TIUS-1]